MVEEAPVLEVRTLQLSTVGVLSTPKVGEMKRSGIERPAIFNWDARTSVPYCLGR